MDLIVGDLALALEFKSAKRVREEDLRGMRAFLEEHRPGRAIVVSRDERPRTTEDRIEILPWRDFCEKLWGGELI